MVQVILTGPPVHEGTGGFSIPGSRESRSRNQLVCCGKRLSVRAVISSVPPRPGHPGTSLTRRQGRESRQRGSFS